MTTLSHLNGVEHEYLSSDSICKASLNVVDLDILYPIEHEYLSSDSIGTCMFVPRITLSPSDSKWHFVLKRRQFPILCVLQ